jgi:hypothetical protein
MAFPNAFWKIITFDACLFGGFLHGVVKCFDVSEERTASIFRLNDILVGYRSDMEAK